MTLRQMEYFLAVVEEGSFSQAASRLNVTQPALSQQVIALEHDLGTALVERLRRGVRITAAGRAYLPHARAALAARVRGRRAVRDVVAGTTGELELATVISVGVGILLRPLLIWHDEMANVAIRLSEFWHRRALEEFAESGNPDLAVGPTPLAWDGAAVTLGYERFVLILAHGDPAARALKRYRGKAPRAAARSVGTLPLAALADRQWVLFDRANGLSEFVEGHLASAGLPAQRASLRTTQFMMAATLAASGMGPTLIPSNVVPADLDCIVCEPDPPLLRSLSAYSLGSLEGLVGRFIDLVRQHSPMLESP
jgi:DNA-binding transcriptional LysR family regulator